jgi:hypothetical protein
MKDLVISIFSAHCPLLSVRIRTFRLHLQDGNLRSSGGVSSCVQSGLPRQTEVRESPPPSPAPFPPPPLQTRGGLSQIPMCCGLRGREEAKPSISSVLDRPSAELGMNLEPRASPPAAVPRHSSTVLGIRGSGRRWMRQVRAHAVRFFLAEELLRRGLLKVSNRAKSAQSVSE